MISELEKAGAHSAFMKLWKESGRYFLPFLDCPPKFPRYAKVIISPKMRIVNGCFYGIEIFHFLKYIDKSVISHIASGNKEECNDNF